LATAAVAIGLTPVWLLAFQCGQTLLRQQQAQELVAAAERNEREGRIAEACDAYEQATGLTPNDPAIHTALANLQRARERYRDAQRHYEAAVRLQPGNPKVHVNLGALLASPGRWRPAFEELDVAVQLAPDDAEALTNLAGLLAFTNDQPLHDSRRAVVLARRACEVTNFANAEYLQSAIDICRASGDSAAAAALEQRAARLAQGE